MLLFRLHCENPAAATIFLSKSFDSRPIGPPKLRMPHLLELLHLPRPVSRPPPRNSLTVRCALGAIKRGGPSRNEESAAAGPSMSEPACRRPAARSRTPSRKPSAAGAPLPPPAAAPFTLTGMVRARPVHQGKSSY